VTGSLIKGSGTTLVEAKLLDRNAIGVDINLDAVLVARNRLNFSYLIGNTRKNTSIMYQLLLELCRHFYERKSYY